MLPKIKHVDKAKGRGVVAGATGRRRNSSSSGKIDVDDLTTRVSGLSVSGKSGGRQGTGISSGVGKRRFSVSNLTAPGDVARALGAGHFQQVVCLVGAGISTSSGIPDFRSKGTGLYDNLAKYKLPEPEAIFELDFYRRKQLPFITLAQELFPGKYKPNKVHHFLRLLHEKKVLRRIYTQNIDGLERLAGLPEEMLVEAHGTFSSASCIDCQRKQSTSAVRATIMEGKVPRCVYCKGLSKPDIVFFGEDLPRRFNDMRDADLKACDLLLVMGTSLAVYPFADLVNDVRASVPRLLINWDLVGPFRRQNARRPGSAPDLAMRGDMLKTIQTFVAACCWEESLAKLETDYVASCTDQSTTCDDGAVLNSALGNTVACASASATESTQQASPSSSAAAVAPTNTAPITGKQTDGKKPVVSAEYLGAGKYDLPSSSSSSEDESSSESPSDSDSDKE